MALRWARGAASARPAAAPRRALRFREQRSRRKLSRTCDGRWVRSCLFPHLLFALRQSRAGEFDPAGRVAAVLLNENVYAGVGDVRPLRDQPSLSTGVRRGHNDVIEVAEIA